MILILTMAGHSQRFIDEGYKIPKYLFPWGSRSILWTILDELSSGFFDTYLIANLRDQHFMPHVEAIMESRHIPRENLYLINDTSGQAETAYTALELLKYPNIPIVFHNIDTVLYGRNITHIEESLQKGSGYIDVFSSNNQSYSYVLVDPKTQRVTEIAEKIVISNLATSGLYGFVNSNAFLDHYDPKCIFITDVYRNLLNSHGKIFVSEPHSEEDTVVLGTPSEYFQSAGKLPARRKLQTPV